MAVDPEVAANYRALKSERGLSWEQLAQQFPSDRTLAAWCRQQATPEGPKPRGRNAPGKSDA